MDVFNAYAFDMIYVARIKVGLFTLPFPCQGGGGGGGGGV